MPQSCDDTQEQGLSSASTASGQLQRAVLERLREKEGLDEIPTSIRFLFYELEQRGVVSKRATRQDGKPSKRKPDQNLIDAVTHLRESGLIPWDWLVDESRRIHNWHAAPTVAAWVVEAVERARIDPWGGYPRPVLITESRGVGGVLARGVAAEYLVPVAPVGGNCTGFLVNEVVPLLQERHCRVLYVGDADDCGNDIEEHTKAVLERHTGCHFTDSFWERVALTEEHVAMLRREGVSPVSKKDKRYRDDNPHEAFEAEAVGQERIVRIVRDRLDELLPEPLAAVLERQEAEREAVRRLFRRQER
jgi:hypothetical protein